jgi:hypothetical protein
MFLPKQPVGNLPATVIIGLLCWSITTLQAGTADFQVSVDYLRGMQSELSQMGTLNVYGAQEAWIKRQTSCLSAGVLGDRHVDQSHSRRSGTFLYEGDLVAQTSCLHFNDIQHRI